MKPTQFYGRQEGDAAAMKLNGVLVGLQVAGEAEGGDVQFQAPGTIVTVRPLGEEADLRSDAELVFALTIIARSWTARTQVAGDATKETSNGQEDRTPTPSHAGFRN